MRSAVRLLIVMLCAAVPAVWAVPLTITFEGIDPELQTHVLTYLSLERERERDDVLPARLQRLHGQAAEQIKSALQVFGYYRAQVEGELTHDEDIWRAHYRIQTGEAIRLQNIDVQVRGDGEHDELLQKGLQQFPLQSGQPFEHPQYEAARDSLLRLALQRGYLDAKLEQHEVRVDLHRYRADVVLHMQTGRRYYFGEVTFHQDSMEPEFLSRYVRFKAGDPFNSSALLNLQTALSDSGYFQSVEVKPNPQRDNGIADVVPIDVELRARKPRQWRFGVGYATDTGARGTIEHHRLMGREGDKFQSDLLVSEKLRRIFAGYTIPLADPTQEQLAFGARFSNEITDSRESYITGVSVSHTSSWEHWRRTVSLNREREVYVVADLPEETKTVLYPVLSFDRVRADDRLHTRHGSRVHLELRGANENLFSDTNFGQARVGLKWIRRLGPDGRVILRGDLGTTNVADLDKLPASQRFFAGGDYSVRGYAFEELGPKNDRGEVVGGKHLMVGSIELEHKIEGNWSAALFYDAGNAVNSLSDKLARGAGLGLRWNSPVGPVRFDFAWGLNKTEDKFRLHIIIGPDL